MLAHRPAPDPRFAEALRFLRAGKPGEARTRLDALIRAEPRRFEAHHLRGIIAFQMGDGAEALKSLERARSLDPDHPQLLSDLGMILHARKDNRAARATLRRALELAPDSAGAHCNMGNVCVALGQQHLAWQHFRRALQIQPDLGPALVNLSRLLLSMGQAGEAAELARRLIDRAPANPLGHSRLALALDRLGRFEESQVAHLKAISLAPEDNSQRLAYAASLAGYGHMDEAKRVCREALETDPHSIAALVQLAGLLKSGEDDGLFARIETKMADQTLSASDRAALGFALGRHLEQQKQYGPAFTQFLAANKAQRAMIDYSNEKNRTLHRDVRAAFTPSLFKKFAEAGDPDQTPVFIVGMPRSGTTLTEQILSSHAGIFGAGEPTIMRALADEACDRQGVSTFAGLMDRIGAAGLAGIGRSYVERLRTYAPDASHIIDKVPSNFLFIGLIHLVLPEARIIHCRRAAADTCLSIFKNRFVTGNLLFGYDLDDLAAHYAAYRRLMAYWHEVLPGLVYDLDYEAMVTDQRGESERLYAHCGLDWTDAALTFHETARPVHTASIAQVRQPIYAGSKGLAARYGDAARPLVKALEKQGLDPFAP